jgi:DNA-binding NarL/FixJ family response regulator
MVRRGFRLILDGEPDLTVVAEASDGAEAVELARRTDLDVAILDVSMPRLTGLQAAREIQRVAPEIRVLMLSIHDNEQYFLEALRIGASGYVLKSGPDQDLVQACHAAMRDEAFLYPGTVSMLVKDYLSRAGRGDLPPPVLSPREEEVVKLIAEGNSTKEIAEQLVISVKTVDRHRSNALAKLGMRDRLDLTRYAIRTGLVEP